MKDELEVLKTWPRDSHPEFCLSLLEHLQKMAEADRREGKLRDKQEKKVDKSYWQSGKGSAAQCTRRAGQCGESPPPRRGAAPMDPCSRAARNVRTPRATHAAVPAVLGLRSGCGSGVCDAADLGRGRRAGRGVPHAAYHVEAPTGEGASEWDQGGSRGA